MSAYFLTAGFKFLRVVCQKKSSNTIADFPLFLSSSVHFCLVYFQAVLLDACVSDGCTDFVVLTL